jgi:antitoxin VapB
MEAMMHTESQNTAKLFINGGSQAVRLPAEFRFDGAEVFIRRDPRSGDVVLSPKHRKSWSSFVALRDQLRAELQSEGFDSFMEDREQPSGEPQRDPFEGWRE